MKLQILLILAIALISSCTHRHKRHHEMQGNLGDMTFEELRAWKTQYLAKKMEFIKQEQACIDKATDKPGSLKLCTVIMRLVLNEE